MTRKKAGVAFWGTAAILAAVLVLIVYPLAWGPWTFCVRVWGHDTDEHNFAWGFFTPLAKASDHMPDSVRSAYGDYTFWWS
jgi:hypothetical protein